MSSSHPPVPVVCPFCVHIATQRDRFSPAPPADPAPRPYNTPISTPNRRVTDPVLDSSLPDLCPRPLDSVSFRHIPRRRPVFFDTITDRHTRKRPSHGAFHDKSFDFAQQSDPIMTSSGHGGEIFTVQLEDTRDVTMHFEVEQSDHLQTVFDQYSKFKRLPLDSLQFTYKGTNIKPDESPASLGMSDGDSTIHVSLIGEALTKETIAQACTAGTISTAVDLLSENKELCRQALTWFDSDGQELATPPIFIAIDYGHCDLVRNLLPLHSELLNKLKDGDGDYTALQWASWTGHLDIVKLLIEVGKAKADEEALSLAREHDHNEVVDFLLKHVDLYSDLDGDADAIMEKACREGDVNMVRKLLEEENYDMAKWVKDGKYLAFSPMYLAVKNGHLDVIQLFAEKGVEVDLTGAGPEPSAE
ncbi:hypothetical protein ACHAWF_016918 [Thalassiosira exigua]